MDCHPEQSWSLGRALKSIRECAFFSRSRGGCEQFPGRVEPTLLDDCPRQITNKKFLLSPDLFGNPYHNSVIRHKLTRNLETVHPDIRDEIVTAFDQGLDLNGNGEESPWSRFVLFWSAQWSEWKSVPAHGIVSRIIYRMMNRILVGLPFCMFSFALPSSFAWHFALGRDREWIDLNMQCDAEIANASVMIAMFPKFLRASVILLYDQTLILIGFKSSCMFLYGYDSKYQALYQVSSSDYWRTTEVHGRVRRQVDR